MAPTGSSSKDTISGQHEHLHELVGGIATNRDLSRLVADLQELKDHLEEHFALEEGESGFHEIVLGKAPRYITRVQRLFEEHRNFLKRIDEIEQQARACLEGPVAQIFCQVTALTTALKTHEERETEMLGDAMYTETGFGG